MGIVVIIIILFVIGLFVWAHFKVKSNEARLLEENPGALYPFFGVFTSRCIYTTDKFEKDVILVNSDTGKIYIDGKIYNMSEITKCEIRDYKGGVRTTYEDKTYIQTNTGSAIGRAVVGQAVAGGVGAIIGASTATKEIKTERVAKNSYVGPFSSMYLEVNNLRQFVNVHAKSNDELWDVVSYINNELFEYRKKQKDEKKGIEEKWTTIIKSPFNYTLEEIKQIDSNSYGSPDSLYLSKEFVAHFANIIGLKGITFINLRPNHIDIHGEVENIQDIKDAIISLDKYVISIFGTPKRNIEVKAGTLFFWDNGLSYDSHYSEKKEGKHSYYVNIDKKTVIN